MAEACIRYDPVQITSPIVIIKAAIKKVYEDGPQEIIMAIEFKRIKNGYEQYIKDIGGIQ